MSSGLPEEGWVACHIFQDHECQGGDRRGECVIDGRKS